MELISDPQKILVIFGIVFAISIYALFFWLFIRRKEQFLRSLRRFIRGITYSETYDSDDELLDRVIELELRLKSIQAEFENKLFKENTEIIEKGIEGFLSQHLPEMISRKLQELKSGDNVVLNEIESITKEEVKKYLKDIDIDALTSNAMHFQSAERKRMDEKMLDEISMEQLRNSGRIKTVMINLFVFFNLGILMFYIFGNPSKWAQEAIYGIVGLYVSLAAFIIYIYRVANARTAVVMAIREDSKKYYDVVDYLARFKPNGEITEHDVDLIRMLVTNRSEREKGTEHPYEMIFKSVADSNIQFKGGKINISKNASKGPNK